MLYVNVYYRDDVENSSLFAISGRGEAREAILKTLGMSDPNRDIEKMEVYDEFDYTVRLKLTQRIKRAWKELTQGKGIYRG